MSKRKYQGKYVSRGGEKLAFALETNKIDVSGLQCADFGSSTGGFTDCLLQNGASKVYAIDTGYGVLDYKLRNDPRVIVMERTNAMHVVLPESVDVITIDTSWTKQEQIMSNALRNLSPDGFIISLIKPHYETSASQLVDGKLPDDLSKEIMLATVKTLEDLGYKLLFPVVESPIRGSRAGNLEYLIVAKHS